MDGIRNLGFLLKDVSRLWVRYFTQHADQLGLTLTHAKVLVFLSRNEGTTQARLAEICDTDPMTLVRTLDRMQNDGWLERRPVRGLDPIHLREAPLAAGANTGLPLPGREFQFAQVA